MGATEPDALQLSQSRSLRAGGAEGRVNTQRLKALCTSGRHLSSSKSWLPVLSLGVFGERSFEGLSLCFAVARPLCTGMAPAHVMCRSTCITANCC